MEVKDLLILHIQNYDCRCSGDVMNQGICSHGIGPVILEYSGPRLNIKTVLSTYGDFHVKDKTAARTSYL